MAGAALKFFYLKLSSQDVVSCILRQPQNDSVDPSECTCCTLGKSPG